MRLVEVDRYEPLIGPKGMISSLVYCTSALPNQFQTTIQFSRIHTYIHIYILIYIQPYILTYIQPYTDTSMHKHIYIYSYASIHTQIPVCMHVYTYANIHIHV